MKIQNWYKCNNDGDYGYQIGLCYFELRDYDQAIYHYDKALEIDPHNDLIAEARLKAKQQKEKSKIIEENVKQHMELIMQKQLLTEYLEETQKELDAHFELLESKGKLPKLADCFDDGTLTEIEWGYEDDLYTFGLKQDCWLIYNGQYIAFGSEKDMRELSCDQEDDCDSSVIEIITPTSVLLKRKEWLLTQIKQLEN